MRIVLDTNCLLPAIFEKSPYYWVWEAFCENQFILCCSTDIIQEYEELLSDFIVTNDRHFNVLKEIGFPPINVIDIEYFKNLVNA
jgi:predicted nucleic acid-binding protein